MVFKRLFSKSSKSTRKEFRTPAGQRLYAIGDVHGRLDLLEQLIALIDADHAARAPADMHLILLGDLIDRGPQSKGVVDRIMALVKERSNVRCLGGNHEDLFLRILDGDAQAASVFHRVGGRDTLISYGVDPMAYETANLEEVCGLAQAVVPAEHIAFLTGLEDYVLAGEYLFVHAGITPGKTLANQTREEMRWIRREFTECMDDFGLMVIHGHTITEEVDVRPNRIGIDTGAYASNRLTAIGLDGTERWFLST